MVRGGVKQQGSTLGAKRDLKIFRLRRGTMILEWSYMAGIACWLKIEAEYRVYLMLALLFLWQTYTLVADNFLLGKMVKIAAELR